jgi:hypothetical protein
MQERMKANMKETMERQIGSLISIMEATRKTDRDKMKQKKVRARPEHIMK